MIEKKQIASAKDGLMLSFLVSTPVSEPKGVLQLCHGMCEHKERYIDFMEYLSANGWVCVIHDHRGHGESIKSKEDLGYMYHAGWKGLIDDIHTITWWIRNHFKNLPIVLFGHSMGSLAVRSYTKRWDNELKGLIVCGCPSFNFLTPVACNLAWMLHLKNHGYNRPALLQRLTVGSFNKKFKSEGPNAWVVGDPEARALYNNDPLCQYSFTANGFYNLLAMTIDCYSRIHWGLSNLEMPVHFMSGSQDPCRISDRKLDRAVNFMRHQGYHNVDLTVYDGMRHEILNETDKQVVWEDVLHLIDSWI